MPKTKALGGTLEKTLRLLVRTFYRVRVEGIEGLPSSGGALLVSNHLAFVDPLLLMEASRRSIRFLMHKRYYEHFALNPFAAMLRTIPISSEQQPREMIRSLRAAGDHVKAGELVCIFAEGMMTRTGELLPFHRGMETIMKGVDAPIIPVHLGGVWGSIFSNERGRYIWKVPRLIPYPVTIRFGPSMPATSTAPDVRAAVEKLAEGEGRA